MDKLNKKEKMYQTVILVLSLIIVFGAAFFASELKGCKRDVKVEKKLTEITYSDVAEIMNSDTVQLIYLAQDGCGHCQAQKPILISVMTEYDVDVNYIDVTKLSSNDSTALYNLYGSMQEAEYSLDGIRTPTMLYVSGGKVVHMTLGSQDEDTLVELFKEYKLISE